MSMFRNLLMANRKVYDELEYIKCTGTQKLDTGVDVTNLSDEFGWQMQFSYNKADITKLITTLVPSGNLASLEYSYVRLSANVGNYILYYRWGGTSSHFPSQDLSNQIINASINYLENNLAIFNENSVEITWSDTLTLAQGNIISSGYIGKFYKIDISKNNEILRDFIPVKLKKALTGTESYYNGRTTNIGQTIGMWDLIENKFYGSETTTNFISEE